MSYLKCTHCFCKYLKCVDEVSNKNDFSSSKNDKFIKFIQICDPRLDDTTVLTWKDVIVLVYMRKTFFPLRY